MDGHLITSLYFDFMAKRVQITPVLSTNNVLYLTKSYKARGYLTQTERFFLLQARTILPTSQGDCSYIRILILRLSWYWTTSPGQNNELSSILIALFAWNKFAGYVRPPLIRPLIRRSINHLRTTSSKDFSELMREGRQPNVTLLNSGINAD